MEITRKGRWQVRSGATVISQHNDQIEAFQAASKQAPGIYRVVPCEYECAVSLPGVPPPPVPPPPPPAPINDRYKLTLVDSAEDGDSIVVKVERLA